MFAARASAHDAVDGSSTSRHVRASIKTITTIGLYVAKSVFLVHGVDAAGQVVVRRQLKRRYVLAFFQKLPPCLIFARILGVAPEIAFDGEL